MRFLIFVGFVGFLLVFGGVGKMETSEGFNGFFWSIGGLAMIFTSLLLGKFFSSRQEKIPDWERKKRERLGLS